MLDLTFANHLKNGEFGRNFFYNVFRKAVQKTGLAEKRIGLSLSLVGKAEIQKLNRDYRGKNKATDVLSFPLNEKKEKKLATGAKFGGNDILELGDIFICLPAARENAAMEKRDLSVELNLLAIHGFLHLSGLDHETPADKRKMLALQKKILK